MASKYTQVDEQCSLVLGLASFLPLLPLTVDVSLSLSEYTVQTRLVARFCLELQLCSSSRTKFGLSPKVWHSFSKVGFAGLQLVMLGQLTDW